MSELIAHRGPDGHGLWERERGGVAFGHRRLSIIDLTTGEQPMTDGDGAWVTYNGEIYNYVEVREVLGERGFRTTSDTEVLLRAYRRWGVDCLAQLRGMFAFALWDESEQTLFCARDRFGIKPLYYAQVDGMLVLASEAKALLPFLPSHRDRPRGPAGLPHLPVRAARQDALPRTSRSCCRATTWSCGTARSRCGATGKCSTSPTSTTPSATSRTASTSSCRTPCGCTCAPTCRSAPTSPAGSTPASSRASPPARPAMPSRASRAAST